MDRTGASFNRTVEMIVDRLKAVPAPIQLPIGSESNFKGIVDLIDEVAYVFHDELGQNIERTEIPADMVEEAKAARHHLVELIAESNEELTMRYLEDDVLTPDELRSALRVATIAGQLVPILCGSSLKNKGVQLMLDAIVQYLPSPLDVPPVVGIDPRTGEEVVRSVDLDAPFAALVHKIAVDPHVGKLAFIRVYSGKLDSGSYVSNTTKGERERIGRLLQMHANHREDIASVSAGDIAAMAHSQRLRFGFTPFRTRFTCAIFRMVSLC
jgi:elongation factor G